MTDLPTHVEIFEEGPREGFQIEPGPIATADKIALIEALAATGLSHIQVCSFVNPRLVPGWADAEAVCGGFAPRPGVHYAALWFNENEAALSALVSPTSVVLALGGKEEFEYSADGDLLDAPAAAADAAIVAASAAGVR